ncbi:MAG: ParA family protein [Holosporales bacterium]|jgi:chromosome partitioning protein|nr:ParA family protein [Holosporales bacterium]
MKIVAIANQKGGVGKTTTAVNLSTALAATRRRVLLVDCDAQGNATSSVYTMDRVCPNCYTLFTQQSTVSESAQTTSIPFLSLISYSSDLAALEVELAGHPGREECLHRVFQGYIAEQEGTTYDYVFIDCPPVLGLITLNALIAADSVLIPLQSEFFALQGLAQLLKTVQRVKQNFNARLKISGIVLTMFEPRNLLCHQVAQDVKAHFRELLFDAVIPRNVRVSEASSHGKPVLLYDTQCRGSVAYINLAKEFLRREERT